MEPYIHEVGRNFFIHEDIKELYNVKTLNLIRNKSAKILKDVHPDGKDIYVSDEVIKGVITSLYKNDFSNIYLMIDMTIHIITTSIIDEFKTIHKNNQLSPWVQQYGSNDQENKWGLASHSKIKLRERRPTPMIFNMRY